MNKPKLGRRDALSGSLAAVFSTAPEGCKDDSATLSSLSQQDADLMQGDSHPSPFRASFLTWFREQSTRFVLPVSVAPNTSLPTELCVQGIHPAIDISIEDFPEINVYVDWKGLGWDQLLWLYASEEPCPSGIGWIDDSVLPEFRVIHPTREALWRANMFEHLLSWINEDLAQATHLAIWGSPNHATWARLIRDGKVMRHGHTIDENGGTPAYLLQVHGYVA